MKKNKLALYYIDAEYIQYLKEVDNNVQHNYDNSSHKKPYVGVILIVNNKHYYAPLTSPKEKHLKLRDSDPTTFKIKYQGKFIGSILINNMIPVKPEQVEKVDINSIADRTYRNLLQKDYQVISNNRDKIQQKAKVLYENIIQRENKYFSKVSCDFLKLEQACEKYQLRLTKGQI